MHVEPNRPGKRQYRTRMLWYYERIIDLMLANPQARLQDIATTVGKAPSTISMIINSDMFKAAYNRRRAEFTAAHDLALLDKTQKLANGTLDAILSVVDKKKDTIPLSQLMALHGSAMDRLGYGVEKNAGSGIAGGVTVNVGGPQTNVMLPPQITREQLEEARMAVRQTQTLRLIPSPQGGPIQEVYDDTPVPSLAEERSEEGAAFVPSEEER